MQSQPNGGTLSPEEAQALARALAQQVAMLLTLAPHLTPTQAEGLMTETFQIQTQLGQVIEDAVDPAARAAHSHWGVKFHVKGDKPDHTGIIRVPKNPADCADLHALSQFSHILGLLVTPITRAVLAAYGVNVEFIQAKAPSQIVLP